MTEATIDLAAAEPGLFGRIRQKANDAFLYVGGITDLAGQTLRQAFRGPYEGAALLLQMEQVGVRPNGEGTEDYARAHDYQRQAHQPTKALSRSRAQVNSRTPPRMAVTVTFTADIVCMSRCMVRGSDPECRLGAHRRAAAVTTRFTAGQQFQ